MKFIRFTLEDGTLYFLRADYIKAFGVCNDVVYVETIEEQEDFYVQEALSEVVRAFEE